MTQRRATVVAVPVAVGLAAYADFLLFADQRSTSIGAVDTYDYFIPNILLALRALAAGGRGLLWNPFQNCGQPFFAMPQTGLLYPANLLFLFLSPGTALWLLRLLNLVIGAFGTYMLCRQLGVRPVAAALGAITFDLGTAMATFTSWTPIVATPYAWLPVALLLCERILSGAQAYAGVALGIVLALSLLSGYPQIVFFTYLLILFRLLWWSMSRYSSRRAAAFIAIGIGLLSAPALAAIQLLPTLDVVGESIRQSKLHLADMAILKFLTWNDFRECLGSHPPISLQLLAGSCSPVIIPPLLVASLALLRRGARHVAGFYFSAALLSFLLAFGPNNERLFALYIKVVPAAGWFRGPERALWVTSFCLAVLTALGLETLFASPRQMKYAGTATMLALLVLVLSLNHATIFSAAGVLAVAMIVTSVVVDLDVASPRSIGAVAVGAVIVSVLPLSAVTTQRLLPNLDPLFKHAATFSRLRARMTAQERTYLVASDTSLMSKSASVFGIPSIDDYEPLTSRRYAEFFMMLRNGRPMRDVSGYLWSYVGAPSFRPRLLNLVAVRYVVSPHTAVADDIVHNMRLPLSLVEQSAGVAVYENPAALPRAFYVPQVVVVANRDEMLQRLAEGTDDLRDLAMVEAVPASGFTGLPANRARGNVEFRRNEPEHVVLGVDAPDHGFVLLTDQYANGWAATINGSPAPILRANHAFRLVEVPRGGSTVEFLYAPASVRRGGAVSAVAAALVLVGCLRRGTRGWISSPDVRADGV